MNYYQALARKWRPQSFNEVIGHKYIIKAISNALSLKKNHHAWIFSGTRGIGKTTISRLLAKSLNCKQGISSNPCRICSNCQSIEKGNFIDLLEIDAASKTKIEDIKESLNNIQYSPVQGRFTIYLIDEVHMLSRYSFNFLLKILEEPPKHIKFILATTNPEKIPNTILSRCLKFNLRELDINDIIYQIKKILHYENTKYDLEALQIISRTAAGSLRDALNLTEQAISMGNGIITLQDVTHMIGTINALQSLSLTIALLKKDANKIFLLLNKIANQGVNWDSILIEILRTLYNIAMLQTVPSLWDNSNYSIHEKNMLSNIASKTNNEDIQLYYQALLLSRKELYMAPSYKIGTEMALLKTLNIKNTRKLIM